MQAAEERTMTRTPCSVIAIILVLLAVFSMAVAVQDRCTLKLNKLAFSDFRGLMTEPCRLVILRSSVG
jgi:hypothetical protein